MKKRIISLCVAFVLIFSILPQSALFANAATIKSGVCGDNLSWTLDESGTLTISGTGAMYNYGQIDADYSIAPWYESKEMDKILSIVIENGVTSIGNDAFLGCSSVTKVSMPETVTRIGHFAFDGCSAIKDISIPESVTEIGSFAFSGCMSMKSVTIPDSVTILGDGVFDCCWDLSEIIFLGNAPSMYVPNNARYEYGTFWTITATVYYPADNSTWTSDVTSKYYGGDIKWVAQEVENTQSNVPLTEENLSDNGYFSAVQQAINDTHSYPWGSGYGALYDIDGNGIEELIMVYSVNAKMDNGYEIPAKACSLYTLSNGKAIPLVDKEILFTEVGGPSGYAAVVERDGKTYFAITSENGDGRDRFGRWNLYTFDGTSLELDTNIKYTEADYYVSNGENQSDRSTAVINGTACSYKEYKEWKNGIEEVFAVYPYDEERTPQHEKTMTLEELLEYLEKNPIETNSEDAGLVVYSDYTNLSIRKGSTITLSAGILDGGELTEDISGITFQIEDTSVLSVATTGIKDNCRYVDLKGVAEGTTTVVFNDSSTGYTAKVPVTVYDDNYLFYTLSNVPTQQIDKYPTNFYNVDGLYIDSYKYTVNGDQSATVSFDVYNTNYTYGAVEVFDENSNMKDAVLVEKMTSSNTGIKEALWDNIGFLVRDIIDGDLLSYRQESGYSKKTSVSVEIPKNGYIKICTDPENSLIVGLVNSVDGLMSMASLAGDIKDFDVNSKEFSEKLTMKLLTDQVYVELVKDGSDASKKLWKNVGKEIFITSESLGSYTDTITKNIDELKLGGIIADTAADFGWDVGENVFTYFSGPAGTALNIIFTIGKVENLIIQQNDLIQSAGVGSIYIQNQGGGLRSCQQIKVESEDELSSDTALNVFTVTLDSTVLDAIKAINPDVYEAMANGITYTYNISLLKNGDETQPNGKVTVYIPIPENLKALAYAGELAGEITGKVKVYRVEEDGNLTEMDVEIEDGCFVFTTDHFSLYTIVGYDSGEDTIQKQEKSRIPTIAIIGIAAVVVVGMVAIVVVKRKKK